MSGPGTFTDFALIKRIMIFNIVDEITEKKKFNNVKNISKFNTIRRVSCKLK